MTHAVDHHERGTRDGLGGCPADIRPVSLRVRSPATLPRTPRQRSRAESPYPLPGWRTLMARWTGYAVGSSRSCFLRTGRTGWNRGGRCAGGPLRGRLRMPSTGLEGLKHPGHGGGPGELFGARPSRCSARRLGPIQQVADRVSKGAGMVGDDRATSGTHDFGKC